MRRISRFSQKTFLFSMALISITGCSLFGMKQAPTIPSFTQSSSENAIPTDEYLLKFLMIGQVSQETKSASTTHGGTW